jgi:hypothetical protein
MSISEVLNLQFAGYRLVGRLDEDIPIGKENSGHATVSPIGGADISLSGFVAIDVDPQVLDLALIQELARPPAVPAPIGSVYNNGIIRLTRKVFRNIFKRMFRIRVGHAFTSKFS